MTETSAAPPPAQLGDLSRIVDGGDMDCGSGLLLLITRAMRRLDTGQLLGIRSAEPSVKVDLPVWAELVGHELSADAAESSGGPWWFAVRKSVKVSSVFSLGERTPVGHRLWAYTNFHCNLACTYCCAESSPKANARNLDPAIARQAFTEFADSGGKELLLTGGEPFLHPQLDEIVRAGEGLERTILTNAMVFGKGRRRQMLEEMDRSVLLQVSLDSATAELHDAQRGAGSWAKAMVGIGEAHELGFRVRIAATMYDEDPTRVEELHARLDEIGIDHEDRVIRPVAAEGFADTGIHVSIDNLEPEPTITADGAWWHPVAVTNPHMRIHDSPLPISEIFGVVRDAMEVQDAATRTGREVFRCA